MILVLMFVANLGLLVSLDVVMGKNFAKAEEPVRDAMEEYIPKVIIDAKWQKVKEKCVPREGDPWKGWLSCGKEIYGRFGDGTISFGYWHQNVEPYPPVMPRSISIDEEGRWYILDPANFRVLGFSRDEKYLETINLERVKPEKGQLGRFEIAEGFDIGELEKFHVNQNALYIEDLGFSKTGKFIGKGKPDLKESFTPKIQSSNKGTVEVIDEKKNVKKEILVNLNPELAEKNYSLKGIEILKKEDRKGNLYIRVTAEESKTHKRIGQIYKYNAAGKLISIFIEKEQLPPIVAITDDGTVYELAVYGGRKEEKKSSTYELDPSDKRIKELEGIEEFLRTREEYSKKTEKITLDVIEGGYEWYEGLKVIKWKKKEK